MITVLFAAASPPSSGTVSGNATPNAWAEFVRVSIDGWTLKVDIGPIIYLGVIVVTAALLWLNRAKLVTFFRRFELVEAEAAIFGLPKFKVRANRENVRIAYEAWIELTTRKAGLPFDENSDTIVEIYDSWHVLFDRLRELAKTVPAHRLAACPETRRLVEIMVEVLNQGLRPHLTKWQARFRRWYVRHAEQNPGRAPQEVQRDYPDYDLLVADLKRVTEGIVIYANWLRQLASGDGTR